MIPNFANILFPLTDILKTESKNKSISLNDEQMKAFELTKKELANVSALQYPSVSETNYHLVCDSSNYAVGAALHQIVDKEPVPIGFYSKKLSSSQILYSTFDRELFAAYQSILHFKSQIEGRNVILFSDHKPLVSAYCKSTPLKSDKQQRQMSLIAEYISDMVYIRGQDNIVADCLSRPVNAVQTDIFDLPSISEQQISDVEFQQYKDKLKPFKFDSDKVIYCETSSPYPRPYVPEVSRKSIFDSLHNISHPGVKSSLRLIKSRYYWPNIDKNVREWAREC